MNVAEISRHALETSSLEEYKSGNLTASELRQVLGFRTRYQLDAFLKERGVYQDYSVEDFRREVETLKRMGL